MPSPDFTNQYNTPIPANKQAAFQNWLTTRGHPSDYYDYDVQGYWLSGAGRAANGHGPDTFKKPNHPTFSTESQYSTPQNPGGHWVDGPQGGNGAFIADPSNLKYHTPGELQQYFKQVEPDTNLYLPPNTPPAPASPQPAMATSGGLSDSIVNMISGLFK
jgi:hypothetical protein